MQRHYSRSTAVFIAIQSEEELQCTLSQKQFESPHKKSVNTAGADSTVQYIMSSLCLHTEYPAQKP